jgi:chemotaxis protein MotA
VAFVATIYGVAMANLIFLPVSHKLKQHIQTEVRRREMLVEGLVTIANGENPRVLENKLAGFLS